MKINAQQKAMGPWTADQGDGSYMNPILHADYSDPDVIRVGDDFYMTSSSFGHIPGLPILHSKDLVNWRLINHAIKRMPLLGYDKPQHGNGVWAPSIRYHDGKYWIFYGDPDVGIFMTTAVDPAGEWAEIHLVKEGKGLIDACPFWDDDGQAYLVHAYAQSRSGIKHRLIMHQMSPDGSRLLGEGVIIVDDPVQHPTIEGPKMYKRNGHYYVFAPAGGVEEGWQTVLRADNPYGPYEYKVVLQQGMTEVNGPHQGAWVELASGESWFIHFQHKEAYGRIVHMQPVHWIEDWPRMGVNVDENGIGEPAARLNKPNVGGSFAIEAPDTSDHFEGSSLGLQWQWQANPELEWYSLQDRPGWLRLNAMPSDDDKDTLFHAPHLLLQKFPALAFSATTLLDSSNLKEGNRAGLIVFGYHYAALVCNYDRTHGWQLQLIEGNTEKHDMVWARSLDENQVFLRVVVVTGALCFFEFSLDGETFERVEHQGFQATVSKWVGAKLGLFAHADQENAGFADFKGFNF